MATSSSKLSSLADKIESQVEGTQVEEVKVKEVKKVEKPEKKAKK